MSGPFPSTFVADTDMLTLVAAGQERLEHLFSWMQIPSHKGAEIVAEPQ